MKTNRTTNQAKPHMLHAALMRSLKTNEEAKEHFNSRTSIVSYREQCAVANTQELLTIQKALTYTLEQWVFSRLNKKQGIDIIDYWAKNHYLMPDYTSSWKNFVLEPTSTKLVHVSDIPILGKFFTRPAIEVGYVQLSVKVTINTVETIDVFECSYTAEDRLGCLLAKLEAVQDELLQRTPGATSSIH